MGNFQAPSLIFFLGPRFLSSKGFLGGGEGGSGAVQGLERKGEVVGIREL